MVWMVAALVLGMNASALAQYPEQPIRTVVPFAAGGFVDSVARTFADRLTKTLGRAIVIDNRAGAGGKIAEDIVAAAPPDGYTLLISGVTRPTLARMGSDAGPQPDILGQFEVVGMLAATPLTLSAANRLEVRDFKSLIARIEAEPDKHSYGSPGPARLRTS
jgi:tripartite-type tricarboxylate transporter receptor subunit TctC